MKVFLSIIAAAGLGYFLGSINFSIIVVRMMLGKDIRDMGSKNAGLTNTLRCAGKSCALLTLIGDLAKLIKQNGVDIGQKRLFEWLRNNGYLMKSGASYNLPTQKSMELKLFEIKERTINNPDGSIRTTKTKYFINKLLSTAMLKS